MQSKRQTALLLLSAAWLWLLPRASHAQRQPKKWTVLVYQGGDGDLEPALIKDFNEMERVGSTPDLNIVVQLDRSPDFDRSNGDWVGARRFLVARDPNESSSGFPNITMLSRPLADLGRVNMGDEDTLVDFVRWGMTNFPAERFFIILADHGAGVRPFEGPARFSLLRKLPLMRGIIFDESPEDFLSNREIKSAFNRIKELNGGKNIPIVGFDASEMSQLENAWQIRGTCDFFIASQLSEPNDGFPYDRFLAELADNPDIGTEDFLGRFVQHYMDSYLSGQPTNGAGNSVTIAVYNMANLSPFFEAVGELASEMRRRLNDVVPGTSLTLNAFITSLRNQTQAFSEPIYRDIFHFAQLVKANVRIPSLQEAAQKVMDTNGPSESGALLFEAHRTGVDIPVDNAHGIAIYFPTPEQFDDRYLTDLDFGRENQWGQFLLTRAGGDKEAPAIEFKFPPQEAKLPLARPPIFARLVDASGVVPESVQVRLDGSSLTSGVSFEERTGRLIIVPPVGLKAGTHTISVTASDSRGNLGAAQLVLTIAPHTLPAGLRALSLPVSLTEGDPRVVLGQEDVKTARWDQIAQSYRFFPDDPFASFLPPDALDAEGTVPLAPAGLGYWVRLMRSVQFLSDADPILPDLEYPILLRSGPSGKPGWNLFGSPFAVPIPFSRVRVLHNGREMSAAEAVNAGLILSQLFRYIPNPNNPALPGEYEIVGGDALQLMPFDAYWLRVRDNIDLIIPGPVSPDTFRSPPPMPPQPRKGWRVRLMVFSEGLQDTFNFFGMSRTASNGEDFEDAPEPPAIPGATLRLYFVPQRRAGAQSPARTLAMDIRRSSSGASWDFVVDCKGEGKEVTLRWSDIKKVPSRYRLILHDLDAKRRVPMHRASSYTFRTAPSGGKQVRRFRIIARLVQRR